MLTARLSDKMNSWACPLGIAVLILALTAATASAGLLTYDDGTYLQGAARNFGDGFPLAADMEYAVYYETAPHLGLDYSGTGLYIYAYQFFVLPESYEEARVVYFNMGLADQNPGISNEGYIAAALDPGYTISHEPEVIGWQSDAYCVSWAFGAIDSGTTEVAPGEQSDIMYFTSPHSPAMDYGSLGGFGTADGDFPFPSPTPEPGTGSLMVLGAISLFLAGAVRRRVLGKK
jgi:hypothetical protein